MNNFEHPFTLPCGAVLKNRIVKSAMSENMASAKHVPGKEFFYLYQRWAQGEVGLAITGNVMVDSRYLGEPFNVVIEQGKDISDSLNSWTECKANTGCKIWVQLNHPGKQSPNFLCKTPVAPSAIALDSRIGKMFNPPRELAENEILDIIQRFAYAAKIVKDSGFDGVQIHGAHGYLVSQFLSPNHNQRTDQWGGSLENRMRFVTEVYLAIRKAVGNDFPIGVKLNSSDFQKGGFGHEESMEVAKELSLLGIDLIEISGGSYENPVMTGDGVKTSTAKREAYFIEYARAIKNVIKCPLLVTGGFRSRQFINQCLADNELDLVGLARPLAIDPDFVVKLIKGKEEESTVHPLTSGVAVLDKFFPLEIIWYTYQLHRMGKQKNPKQNVSPFTVILKSVKDIALWAVTPHF